MGAIRTFVERPVTTVMFVMVFVVLGLVSYQRLSVDLFPELEFPLVQIIMEYPGAGPDELESQIVKKIEDEVSNISDIKEITSNVYEGYAFTIIEFELGVNVDIKALDVKDKVELIRRELPDAAEDPVVVKFDPLSTPVMKLAVTSTALSPRDLYELVDKDLKNSFSQVTGVAKVDLLGGAKRQINVFVKLDKLYQYGLTISSLLQVLANENIDIPAGNLYKRTQEIGVRFKGEARTVAAIENLTFYAPDHGIIKLADVARVEDGSEQLKSVVQFNGKSAVLMDIFKRSDGNTIKVADETYVKIEEIKKSLPPQVTIEIASDESTFIRDSVNNARDNIIMGILLCAGLLFIFLKDLRITLIASIVLPTSIVSAFMLMDFGGFTLNVLTLMALGLSIGALVANAIVVLENIARYVEQGKKPREAAVKATKEIAVAVVAAAGTNIVVFTPIAFMGGIVGQFFYQFGLTVVFATIFSLLASFSLTPMLAAYFIKEQSHRKDQKKSVIQILLLPLDWFNLGVVKLQNGYGKYLTSLLRHPYLVLISTVLVFIGTLQVGKYIGGEFFPASDQNMINIVAQMPKGASINEAKRIIGEIEKIVNAEVPEKKNFTASAGGETKGFDEVTITIRLVKSDTRDRSDKEIMNALQASLAKVPGPEILIFTEEKAGSRADLDIDVFGPDYSKVATLSRQMKQIAMETGNFRGIYNTFREPKDEIHFIPDPYRRADFQVPNVLLGLTLRYAIEGEKGSVLRVAGEEYDIKFRLEETARDSIDDLKTYQVPSENGFIPLTMLGTFERKKGIAELTRKDKERVITLQCFISQKSLTENVALLGEEFKKITFPEGYHYEFAGQSDLQEETSQSVATAFILAILLTYMLLAAILNSFVHPITMLITVPLGMVGVLLTLFFTGISFNLMSMMAIVMLVGIVVNNAILIIDYTLQKMNTCSESLEDCVQEASVVKFRAILMTNLAIIAGIFPQLMGGSGTEFMVPMAAATVGGVALSTLFTFFTIPALFVIIEKLVRFISSLFRRNSDLP